MLVSCLMPTFNRLPSLTYLIEEAIESFVLQDHPQRELLICNDTPGQKIAVAHPKVKVFNLDERLPDLSSKIQYMIDRAQGEAFCRWDDDDINLPHRLSMSVSRLADGAEWRPENYYFDPGTLRHVIGAANTHVMAIFTRECLRLIGGYPPKYSGFEDIAFNDAIAQCGLRTRGDVLPQQDVFYLYRWATGSHHLSGVGGPSESLQAHYDRLGTRDIQRGEYRIRPRWHLNHVDRVRQAAQVAQQLKPYDAIVGHFDYEALYDHAVARTPRGGRLVEVGCFRGRSLVYLANVAKKHGKRLAIHGIDLGIGDGLAKAELPAFAESCLLLNNLQQAGVQDIASVMAGESTALSQAFADESLDVVFIDGRHGYGDVRCDLQCWWPKLKRGGLIGGHDYVNPDFPGVAKAVDEFFEVPHQSLRSTHSASCWEKVK